MFDDIAPTMVAALGALLGSVVGAITTYLVQVKLIRAQSQRDLSRELMGKQLIALQELCLIIDFVQGNVGKTQGGPVADLFVQIVKDSPRQLAFIPSSMRDDARKLMFEFFKAGRGEPLSVVENEINDLRARVLKAIDETSSAYRHDS